eukprot:6171927-Pleurochrysis_carterae.AAC.4
MFLAVRGLREFHPAPSEFDHCCIAPRFSSHRRANASELVDLIESTPVPNEAQKARRAFKPSWSTHEQHESCTARANADACAQARPLHAPSVCTSTGPSR